MNVLQGGCKNKEDPLQAVVTLTDPSRNYILNWALFFLKNTLGEELVSPLPGK